jgi:6-phosphogluconate dehydrogenase
MDLGMIGLGRMGGNMALRLVRRGHRVVGWDRLDEAVRALAAGGGVGAASLDALVAALPPPRAIWLMVAAGAPTEETIRAVAERLGPGDVVIDGGNTFYKDDVRRAHVLAARGIRLLDVGTSGGVLGLERGYCLMVGGDRAAFERLEPVFRALAPGRSAAPPTPGATNGPAEEGYLYCGPSGAGHYVKMIHNGIEYGLMQAYAEGFDLLRAAGAGHPQGGVAGAAGAGHPAAGGAGAGHSPDSPDDPDHQGDDRYDLDLAAIAEVWRRGSIIGSSLLDLAAAALADDPRLDGFTGAVDDSGEGRWTVQAAVERGVAAPALTAALYARFRSRQASTFGEKLLSALRARFGGHREVRRGGTR